MYSPYSIFSVKECKNLLMFLRILLPSSRFLPWRRRQ